MKVSVIIPTVTGREESLARAIDAYKATKPDGVALEIIVLRDRPTCGAAWNEGAAIATGDYLHVTADDIEPLPGWCEAAIDCVEGGVIPSAYLELPWGGTDGDVLPDGHLARMTPLPFCRREEWPGVAVAQDGVAAHYGSDYDVSHRLREQGWEIKWVHAYRFLHHRVQDSARRRMERRYMMDVDACREAMCA